MSSPLVALGLPGKSRIARHRKLSEQALASFRAEVEKIIALKTYKQLADESGLTLGSVQQLMAQLLRERREGSATVHRGTQLLDVEILATSATLASELQSPRGQVP